MKNEIVLRPSYWASVSGGKDSLYMLKLILDHPDLYQLDGVVHFELELDYPFIKNVIDYMQSECEKNGIKFVRIQPSVKWIDLYNKLGYPNGKARWCRDRYKLDAKRQLEKFLKNNNQYLVSYIGYCKDEVKRYQHNHTDIYPLVDFDIEEKDILEWAKKQPVFNDYYISNTRCGCMGCPLSRKISWAYLYKYYPDYYTEILDLMRKSELLWPQAKYNSADYIDHIVKTKWLDRLNNSLRETYNC